jgi:hypothetical protein
MLDAAAVRLQGEAAAGVTLLSTLRGLYFFSLYSALYVGYKAVA